MTIVRQRRRHPRVDIVPMIDVVFFLVVFFMLFTTFRTDPTGIQIDLPRAATGAVHDQSELRISVTQQGTMFINGTAASENDIRAMVQSAVRSNPNTLVIVSADRRVAYEHVVRAMDAAREAGGHRLALSVETPG